MPDPIANGLRAKDVSDWIKIFILLAGMGAGYASLRAQVQGHTEQIEGVKRSIGEMRDENETRSRDLNKKIGAITMYLCSKDSTRCSAENLPEQ